MAKLKGKYTFKEVLDVEGLIAAGELTEYFNFISGYEGNPVQHYVLEHSGMYIEYDYFGTGIYFGYLTPPDNTMNLVYYTRWQNERLRYVDFGDGVNMSDRLSSWVLANADPVVDPEYSIKTSTLTAIADSIRAKTGGSDPILTENMASEIEGIDTAEPWDESFTVKEGAVIENLTQLMIDTWGARCLFYNGVDPNGATDELIEKMFAGVDTSNVTSMRSMFQGCGGITKIPYLNTSNVTDMGFMFQACRRITTIPNIDTGNVVDMLSMFYVCNGLKTIKSLNMSKVTNANSMFYYCNSLEFVELVSPAQIYNSMFENCLNLTTLVLRTTDRIAELYSVKAFNVTPFSGYNNLKGTVYVPSALIETYKTATNWSTLYAQGTCTFLPIEGSEYE